MIKLKNYQKEVLYGCEDEGQDGILDISKKLFKAKETIWRLEMQMSKPKSGPRFFEKGFNLIELMIVVAIIGVLASIAIPEYRDHLARVRVSEGLNLASGVKAAVAEHWASHGSFISDYPSTDPICTTANINCTKAYGVDPTTGKYSIDVLVGYGGSIVITYNQLLDPNRSSGYTLVLQLAPGEGSLNWVCFSEGQTTKDGVTTYATPSLPAKYAPPICR